MKKKTSKKETPKRKDDNEFSSLNSSLGSFGIEPPKRYREYREENAASPKKKMQKAPVLKTVDERRAEENKKRKNAKLRRKIIFYLGLIIGIAAIIIVLSLTVLFKINTITITGNNIYSNKDISSFLPIEKGDNLFLADTKNASLKLQESLPYIYNVEIKRKLFSTIVVNITETPVIYSIKNEDKTYTLLDGNFKVLEVSPKNRKGAITIAKVKLKSATVGKRAEFSEVKIMDNLLKLTSAIERLKLDKITSINSNDINNNYITYDSRITIKLGTLEKLDDKIYKALAAIDKLNESNPQVEGVMTVSDGKQVYFTEK